MKVSKESIIQDAKRRETRQPVYFCMARLASAVSTWSKLSRRAPSWQDLFEATLRFLFALISSSSSTSATFSVDRATFRANFTAPVSPSWIGHHCNYLIWGSKLSPAILLWFMQDSGLHLFFNPPFVTKPCYMKITGEVQDRSHFLSFAGKRFWDLALCQLISYYRTCFCV